MVGFKFFFIDDPTRPTAGASVLPIGTLALMGAGKVFPLFAFAKELLEWALN